MGRNPQPRRTSGWTAGSLAETRQWELAPRGPPRRKTAAGDGRKRAKASLSERGAVMFLLGCGTARRPCQPPRIALERGSEPAGVVTSDAPAAEGLPRHVLRHIEPFGNAGLFGNGCGKEFGANGRQQGVQQGTRRRAPQCLFLLQIPRVS